MRTTVEPQPQTVEALKSIDAASCRLEMLLCWIAASFKWDKIGCDAVASIFHHLKQARTQLGDSLPSTALGGLPCLHNCQVINGGTDILIITPSREALRSLQRQYAGAVHLVIAGLSNQPKNFRIAFPDGVSPVCCPVQMLGISEVLPPAKQHAILDRLSVQPFMDGLMARFEPHPKYGQLLAIHYHDPAKPRVSQRLLDLVEHRDTINALVLEYVDDLYLCCFLNGRDYMGAWRALKGG